MFNIQQRGRGSQIISKITAMSKARAAVKQNSKLSDLINYKLRVVTEDGRVYIGELLAFDKYMNMILSDCVEERIPRDVQSKLNSGSANLKVERRILGLTILRGEHILTTVVEDRPLLTRKERIVKAKKEEKKLQKQRNQNKSKTGKSGEKGRKSFRQGNINDNSGGGSGGIMTAQGSIIPPQTRKFQPPPGFKRK